MPLPRPLRPPLAAVLTMVALHMLVFDRGLGGDGWATFATLESLAGDGDPWVEDDHRGVLNGLIDGRDGHLISQYPPGVLLLDALPFFAGRALDRLLPEDLLAGGAELPPAGRVPRGVFLSAAAIVLARNAAALLGLVWTGLALRRLDVPAGRAAAAVGLTFFGGPLVFYSLVGMTHAPTFALAALLFLLLVRQRETGSARLAFAAGAVLGAAVLVRYSAVALLPGAVLALARGIFTPQALGTSLGLPKPWAKGPSPLGGGGLEKGGGQEGGGRNQEHPDGDGPHLGPPPVPTHPLPGGGSPLPTTRGISPLLPWLAFAAGFVLLLLPLPFWWQVCSGIWSEPPYGGGWAISPASPWNVLFAPVHGLFLFHPALAFAAAGLLLAAGREIARRKLGWGAVALVWCLGTALLHGWWAEWANAGGYGQRFLIDALPALALGFAAWLAAMPRPVWRWGPTLAAAAFGYVLFFAAVAGLVPPPPGRPWPQRLDDYAVLARDPPGPREIGRGLGRASFLLRGLVSR